MKKILFTILFILSMFFSKITFAQIIDTPIEHYVFDPKVIPAFPVTGRVIGVNLEDVTGADIVNMCLAEKSKTDSHGTFHINAAIGDTLLILTRKYSTGLQRVKSSKENLNVILIRRKVDLLPPGYSRSDYNKARREDEELIRILEKDAKLEGKWKY
jgi:hypothetical protein